MGVLEVEEGGRGCISCYVIITAQWPVFLVVLINIQGFESGQFQFQCASIAYKPTSTRLRLLHIKSSAFTSVAISTFHLTQQFHSTFLSSPHYHYRHEYNSIFIYIRGLMSLVVGLLSLSLLVSELPLCGCALSWRKLCIVLLCFTLKRRA